MAANMDSSKNEVNKKMTSFKSAMHKKNRKSQERLSKGFHTRLKQLIGKESESRFAKRAGIAKSGLNRILKGGTPTLDILIAIANAAKVSIDWLATGKVFTPPEEDIPVIGFAECGLKGWYNEVALTVSAHKMGNLGNKAFAVIAVGDSMRPAGIEQGFLCYCDPADQPSHLDAVHLRKRDGTSSLKIYGGKDGDWLKLQGWLKPDANGIQKPYVDRLKSDQIVQIAPVIYIKRKL
jgi:transcriptional regulator with XRE-family HTH domain